MIKSHLDLKFTAESYLVGDYVKVYGDIYRIIEICPNYYRVYSCKGLRESPLAWYDQDFEALTPLERALL